MRDRAIVRSFVIYDYYDYYRAPRAALKRRLVLTVSPFPSSFLSQYLHCPGGRKTGGGKGRPLRPSLFTGALRGGGVALGPS